MADALPNNFLDDLDDLSDDEHNEEDAPQQINEGADVEEGDKLDAALADIRAQARTLSAIATLRKQDKFVAFMENVGDGGEAAMAIDGGGSTHASSFSVDIITRANEFVGRIEDEMRECHTLLVRLYAPRFPELASLVPTALDYARVVKLVADSADVATVDLSSALPSALVMVVTVTASTTSGTVLAEDKLKDCTDCCDEMLGLDQCKKTIVKWVEDNMGEVAPNLSAVVGTQVASNLIASAGSLESLSKMPACNVQTLGSKKSRGAAGGHLSTNASGASSNPHLGYVFDCPQVQGCPPGLRTKAVRLLSSKCVLMARVDAFRGSSAGETGDKCAADCATRIEKWQEAPPAKIAKPLPAPIEQAGKRRGGKRLRAKKENYGQTELMKAANRMLFGKQEEEVIDGDEFVGLGTLGQEGNKRLRIGVKDSKLGKKLAQKQKEQKGKFKGGAGLAGAASGLASVAFTPMQGIELVNPNVGGTGTAAGADSGYFSTVGGFSRLGNAGNGGMMLPPPPKKVGGMLPPPPKKN